ncbi:MAG: hypothetical protein V4722_23140 [Bacteroidota bacterium]
MYLFTPEDLLEYYYQETSPEKSQAIALELENNWALQQKFDVICQAAERLDKTLRSPRPASVQSVMDYATAHLTAQVN